MTEKKKVLWIEDDAIGGGVSELTAPVYTSGEYELTIASDVTEGIKKILENTYDMVVVDMRLLPGADKTWIKYHQIHQSKMNKSLLGLKLLHALFCHERSEIRINPPKWAIPSRFGILTIEPENKITEELEDLDIIVHTKTIDMDDEALLNLIQNIHKKNATKDV